MTSRKQFFIDLRELIDSAESNFDHGRPDIGNKKLIRAYLLLGSAEFPKPPKDVEEGKAQHASVL